MITGFCSVAEDDMDKVYDYSGCIYPEGYLSSNKICLFDHNQISELFYLGYENEEESEFKKTLNNIINNYNTHEFINEDEKTNQSKVEIESLEYL